MGIQDAMHRWADCIAACNACAVACHHCAAACLQEPDVKSMARCIALDMDCAQICQLAAAFMAGGSEHAAETCRLCARICRSCGDECGQHEADHCQQCAEACRHCAEACERMANTAGAVA
ncbi:four-helix bundle copper-binding protein [Ramlibacter rhizophilus]|uniref:Four-helix bundle copper-binding protein n=1 Tax=Ramlibacter rhizophilus TaxID=1781167 RepID=A0A4Z0BJN1_9BURK|nr:four-helix bundle copper-binding protein [Ramlibacter rhizophilus]TFY99496.1 four-helix bundle copper-binding protein [Ramlibacter rhizophilus]